MTQLTTHRSVVAGGCWIGGNTGDSVGGVNTGVGGGTNKSLFVFGGSIKVIFRSFGGGARLVFLAGGVADATAHGEEEVVVYVILGFVLGHPDLLILLQVNHFQHPLVPDIRVIMADCGYQQKQHILNAS